MCAPGDSGVQSDPACIAAHDFDKHDAVMGFRRGMQAINSLGGNDQGGVEAEGDFGSVQIVINGFGDADNIHAAAEKIAGDVLGAVSAYDDEGVNAKAPGIVYTKRRVVVNLLHAILQRFVSEGIAAIGGAKNGAATGKNATDGILSHFLGAFRPDQAVKAVADTDNAHAVLGDGGANHGANHRVQARGVAAAVHNADCANSFHISSRVI